MEVGYACPDYHAKLDGSFFRVSQPVWEHNLWGGVEEDKPWRSLYRTTTSIRPVTRDVIPEHYDGIRREVTRPWPEAKKYKSYEPREETPPWGGHKVKYNSNA